MRLDPEGLADDLEAFGSIEGVQVYNLPDMAPAQISEVISGPGTIIGGFCNSNACLAPFR